jgi:hypothetical protein
MHGVPPPAIAPALPPLLEPPVVPDVPDVPDALPPTAPDPLAPALPPPPVLVTGGAPPDPAFEFPTPAPPVPGAPPPGEPAIADEAPELLVEHALDAAALSRRTPATRKIAGRTKVEATRAELARKFVIPMSGRDRRSPSSDRIAELAKIGKQDWASG